MLPTSTWVGLCYPQGGYVRARLHVILPGLVRSDLSHGRLIGSSGLILPVLPYPIIALTTSINTSISPGYHAEFRFTAANVLHKGTPENVGWDCKCIVVSELIPGL